MSLSSRTERYLISSGVSAAALAAAGLAYQYFGSRRDKRRFPPPGRLFAVNNGRLHLREQGTGSPAVILEAGIAGSSIGWALVQPRIAEFTRVCSYDRAGLAWSDPSAKSVCVDQMVSDLGALLAVAQVPPPYVLVGHSFGGLLARAYAHMNPDKIAGLVLVDPVPLTFWAECSQAERTRLRIGASLSRRGAILARFGVVRLALAAFLHGGRKFPKAISRASAAKASKTLERLAGEIGKLPPETWPCIAAHWSTPKCLAAMAGCLESLPDCARAAIAMPVPSNIPLTVISAANAEPSEMRERDECVRQSETGTHIRAANAGHWIQLEEPELVIDAVRRLVCAVREKTRV